MYMFDITHSIRKREVCHEKFSSTQTKKDKRKREIIAE